MIALRKQDRVPGYWLRLWRKLWRTKEEDIWLPTWDWDAAKKDERL